jgi:hypothetical protein
VLRSVCNSDMRGTGCRESDGRRSFIGRGRGGLKKERPAQRLAASGQHSRLRDGVSGGSQGSRCVPLGRQTMGATGKCRDGFG